MPVIVKLTQEYDQQWSTSMSSHEIAHRSIATITLPGLYILVSSPKQYPAVYLSVRYKDASGKTCHQKIAWRTI